MKSLSAIEGLWFASRKVRLPLSRQALVLEVGSGDSPCPRSDVLFDLTLENHERVGGRTVADRPLVLGRAEQLPFRSKVFDYVLAFHVLEHTPDPEQMLEEFQRVGKAGYIETPSAEWERRFPLGMHRLEVGLEPFADKSRLVIWKKTAAIPKREASEPALTQWASPFHRVTRYWWENQIDYRIANPEYRIDWHPTESEPRGDADPRPIFRRWLKNGAQYLRRRKPVDLLELLQCPRCHHRLNGNFAERKIVCIPCQATFEFIGGVPCVI